ncbi:MAG: ubiquitin-conjugating enzyme E2 [Candidatus Helarchaeota archaeon]|nr:ubiquitin-conjugating enzyme E2 [Candidatus Helarchaeota archaeon]
MLSEEDYYNRLVFEAKILEEEEPSFKPVKGDLRVWRGFILGTGLYDGGVFGIEVTLTRKFPYSPPKVRWLTKIYHPNISLASKVCVGVLGKDWVPTMSVAGVIEALRNLLNFPNPSSPLNTQAATLMKKNKKRYEEEVKRYVMKHATWENLKKVQST